LQSTSLPPFPYSSVITLLNTPLPQTVFDKGKEHVHKKANYLVIGKEVIANAEMQSGTQSTGSQPANHPLCKLVSPHQLQHKLPENWLYCLTNVHTYTCKLSCTSTGNASYPNVEI